MIKVIIANKPVATELDVFDVETIRLKTPVITGILRDGFKVDSDGDISNDVDYADAVELGTSDRPGVFMVERSADEIGERLARRMAEQIERPGFFKLPVITIKVGR